MTTSRPPRVPPLCSVVVPTLGRGALLEVCLSSLGKVEYPWKEILVVHNGAEDGGVRKIAERVEARYLAEPSGGLSRARNFGARAAQGEIVAYLDDDAVADRGWLAGLVREFEDERVMAVTGRILPTKVESDAERAFAALGGFSLADEVRQVLDRGNSRWFELACFGGIGSGANMAFRRSAFELWPGFDERLGAGSLITGGEEHYAFFNLIDRGFRVVHTPAAIIRHPYPATREEFESRAARQLAAAAAYTLFLFNEQPRFRRCLARHVWGSLFKRRAVGSPPSLPGVLGFGSRWRARISGVELFLKSRRPPPGRRGE